MKLPSEYLLRLLTDEKVKGLSDSEKVAIIMMSDADSYTMEDLRKMGIMKAYLATLVTVYSKAGFDEPLFELYDKIKGEQNDLYSFCSSLESMDKRITLESPIKQYLLNDLVGPAWKDPDFLILKADYLGISRYVDSFISDLNKDHNYNIEMQFSNNLCPFDKLPETQLNNIIKGLQLCLPLLKKLLPAVSDKDPYSYRYTGNRSIDYSSYALPVQLPYRIEKNSEVSMSGTWSVVDGKLIIEKRFTCDPNSRTVSDQVPTLAKRLKQKYPEQTKDIVATTRAIRWTEREIYNLPEELRVIESLLKGKGA